MLRSWPVAIQCRSGIDIRNSGLENGRESPGWDNTPCRIVVIRGWRGSWDGIRIPPVQSGSSEGVTEVIRREGNQRCANSHGRRPQRLLLLGELECRVLSVISLGNDVNGHVCWWLMVAEFDEGLVGPRAMEGGLDSVLYRLDDSLVSALRALVCLFLGNLIHPGAVIAGYLRGMKGRT
jgi:hypothetical protein